jgi:hypothetical protein
MTHDVSGKKKNLGAKKKIWEEKKLGAKKNPEQKKKLEQKKNFGSKKATYGKREWFVHHFNPFCSSEKEEEVYVRGMLNLTHLAKGLLKASVVLLQAQGCYTAQACARLGEH